MSLVYTFPMTRFIPIIFILIWSTGFIGAKFGLPYAEPFTLLMWRMIFVVPLFIALTLILKRPNLSLKDGANQALVGFLIHGLYLGGVFAAINTGMPAGLSALFVSLNPLVIGIFSGIVLKTSVSKREWLSLVLGLCGVIIVLYGASNWEGVISSAGIIWLSVALAGICTGTLIQKRFAHHVDHITGSSYQFGAALIFYIILSFSFETQSVDWTWAFIATLAWLVIPLSIVSILLLLYMIRQGEATRVASYFYLVPPITAIQGWLFFDERWSWLTIAGGVLVVGALAMSRPAKKADST
jgi:drug/metabolite transporter (DMT)-like permease